MAYQDFYAAVQKIYVAYYGRPADPGGLIYWAAKCDADGINAVINAFGNSAEATELYGPITSDTIGNVIEQLYQQMFDRAADTAGKAFYVTEFNAGRITAAGIALAVANGATGEDRLTLNNKITAADLFTRTIDPELDGRAYTATYAGEADATAARAWLAQVEFNPVTVPIQSEVTTFIMTSIANAGDPILTANSQSFTLTTAVDKFTGGAGDDTFTGTIGSDGTVAAGTTYSPGDILNGAAGNDTLNISVSGAHTANHTASTETLTSIERINVSNFQTGGFTETIDLALATGVQTVALAGSAVNGDTLFTNVANIVDAEMSNGTGDLTVTYATSVVSGTADTQKLTLSAATAGQFLVNSVETINIVSNGSANSITLSADSAKTVNVTGAQNLTLGALPAATYTVDASTFTGKLSLSATSAVDYKITGGSGNDTFTVTAGNIGAADTITGGSGIDTIILDAAVTAANMTNVTGFETLQESTNNVSQSMTNILTGVTKLVAAAASDGGANTVTFTNVGSGVTDLVVTGTEGIIASLATDTTADSVNLTYGTSTAGVTVAGQTTLNNYETINLLSQGAANTTGTFSATSLKTLTITGDKSLTLGSLAGNTAISTINASGMTSTATLTMNATNGSTTASTITGTANADNLVGGSNADTITGGAGNDTITGAAGNDSIVAGDGADSIDAGAGTDNVSGGAGNDTLYVSTISDFASGEVFNGGDGTDTLSFVDAASTFTAADLSGLVSVEKMQFLATTNATTVTLSDAVFTANGLTTMTIDASTATSGVVTISASGLTAANSLDVNMSGTANTGANNISLGAGNDTLRVDQMALDNTTTLAGGSGTDTLQITANNAVQTSIDSTVTGFEIITFKSATGTYDMIENNSNVASGAILTVDGSTLTTGTLTWTGTAETNGTFVLNGGSGADTLIGGSLNDTISGGSGADSISGGLGIDNLSGGAGDDVFYVANNGAGFVGLTTAEVVSGGDGNDILKFLAGDNVSVSTTDLTGLTSIETIAFTQAGNTAAITLSDAIFTSDGVTSMTIDASTMTLALTVAASSLTAANSLDVNLSNTGNTAANSVVLGAGNDIVRVDDGAMAAGTLTGGSGTDTLSIKTGGSGPIAIAAGITGFEKYVMVAAGDAYSFSSVNDANVASGATLTVDGSALTTGTLNFVGSNETNGYLVLTGGASTDTLTGGSKADTISGGSGVDVITGGSGADNLTGGQGADVFVYNAVAESTGTAIDTITDFLSGTDKLAIKLDYTTTTTAMTVDATILTAAAGVTNAQAALSGNRGQYLYDTDNSRLYVNVNNDNLITTLDYSIGITAASTASATIANGDLNFTIIGSTAADSIVAGAGADTITGGASGSGDTIRGGDGTDTVTLVSGNAAADTVVLTGSSAITATANLGGADVINNFGTTDDIIQFGSSWLGDVGFVTAAGGFVSDSFDSTAGQVTSDVSDAIFILSTSAVQADICDLFAATFTSAMSTVVVAYDGTDSNIFYVNNNLDGTNSDTVLAAEVVLIGTVKGVDATTWDGASFTGTV